MPVLSLNKRIETHRSMIHRGVPDKRPSKLLRLFVDIECT